MTAPTNGKPHKGKSPYAKHGKVPYRYSDAYQMWHQAIKRGDKTTAAEADARHARMVGIRRRAEVHEDFGDYYE